MLLNMFACSKAGSSADESVAPDAEMVESSVAKPASGHDALDSSVAKPVVTTDDEFVLVFYSITMSNDKMTGRKKARRCVEGRSRLCISHFRCRRGLPVRVR